MQKVKHFYFILFGKEYYEIKQQKTPTKAWNAKLEKHLFPVICSNSNDMKTNFLTKNLVNKYVIVHLSECPLLALRRV